MIELRREEVKQIELRILDYLCDVCNKNGLKIYLAYGSLLGAIRHKGFIPWDDDIDVLMFRNDYDKLITILTETNNETYRLLSCENCRDYYYSFAKLVDTSTKLVEDSVPEISGLGVYVDIFPLDGLPNKKRKQKSFIKKLQILNGIRWNALDNVMQKFKGKGVFKFLKCKICSLVGWRACIKLSEKIIRKYNASLKYVGCLSGSISGGDCIMERELFEKQCYVEFEKKKYPSLYEYDWFLKKMYGNYMKLPPLEQRVSNHCFRAWRIDQ